MRYQIRMMDTMVTLCGASQKLVDRSPGSCSTNIGSATSLMGLQIRRITGSGTHIVPSKNTADKWNREEMLTRGRDQIVYIGRRAMMRFVEQLKIPVARLLGARLAHPPFKSTHLPLAMWHTRRVCKKFPNPQAATMAMVSFVARRMALLVKTRQ